MPITPSYLLGAKHVHPHVRTAEDYRAQHRSAIRRAREAYPNLQWRDPWRSSSRPEAFVTGGLWQIRCATPGCGNCPAVEPDWQLALCWDCGAVYDAVVIPAEAEAITQILVQRPLMANRNWLPGETLAELQAQNRAHGLPEETITCRG